MTTEVQQYHIHNGDKKAFYAFCRENGLHVYRRALDILHEESAAKSIAADVLRQFRTEILAADSPFSDVEGRLDALTDALLDNASATPDQPETAEHVTPMNAQTAERETPTFAEATEPALQTSAYTLKETLPEPTVYNAADEIRYDGAAYRSGKWYALITVLAALLGFVLLWIVLAALMRARVLPVADLGYSWFNAHVYDLFHFLT